MKALALLCLTLALAPLAPAALEYVAYDLTTHTADPVTDPVVTDDAYHTGSKILFVRDPALPDQTYYIGVFELTRDQARKLGIDPSSETSGGEAYGVAYSRNNFPFASPPSLADAPGLGFPTAAQWLAYAEQLTEADVDSTNVRGGASLGGAYGLRSWYNDQKSRWKANSHGVIDFFGNAAEYTYTPATGEAAFYGWFASSLLEYQWNNLVKLTPAETKLEVFEVKGDPTAVWGARLIYTPPEERTYTLTVTLDEEPVDAREGLKEGESVTVTAPEPEGQRRLSGREVTGLDSSLDLPEALDAQLTFDMPASDVTIAYSSEPYATLTVENGTATVTHGEETVTADERTQVVAGDVVTLTAREPGAHERFTGWTVTVGDGEPQTIEPTVDETAGESVYRYDIPALDGIASFTFTAAFKSIPYATITVTNGIATVNGQRVTEVEAGDVVTLTHNTLGEHQTLLGWTCPEGITLEEGNTFTVPTLKGGEHYVFTANIRTYPRVLVFGGSVSRVSSGREDGDGYYIPGTSLTLRADTLEGYVPDGWTDGSQRVTSPYTVPADTYDATITLTATYTRDESSEPTVTPADIHLGSTKTEAGYQAHSLFGWTPDNAETTVTDETQNRYHAYPYLPAGLYAILNLKEGSLFYTDSLEGGAVTGGSSMPERPWPHQYENFDDYLTAFDAWAKEWEAWEEGQDSTAEDFDATRLPLRRVTPTDGTAEFYLGVYETSMGQVANLQALCDGDAPVAVANVAAAYCGKNDASVCGGWPSAFDQLRDDLNEAFFGGVERVRYPTPNDLLRVGQTSITKENPDAGKGYQAQSEFNLTSTVDKNLTTKMVIGGGSTSSPGDVNAMTPCYGFYGLWGNGWELNEAGNGFAGSAYNKLNQKGVFLTETVAELPFFGLQSYATFRPAIDVEEAVVIYIGQESAATAVQVAPGQRLFADDTAPTKSGHRFTGWTLGGASIVTDYEVQAGDAGKVLAANWEPLPEHPDSVTVACEDCLGPATAYPGQSVTVHPPEGRTFAAGSALTIEPAGIATAGELNEDGTVTVTFASPLPVGATAVTLQGKLAAPPEPLRPGYRFRLR